MSSQYRIQVTQSRAVWGMTDHLTIERHDGKPIRCGWDTLQRIKNEALGEDVHAIEVFPAEKDVVNEVNRRHFWAVPDAFLSFGLHNR